MTTHWTALFCEGPIDEAFLVRFAERYGGWQRVACPAPDDWPGGSNRMLVRTSTTGRSCGTRRGQPILLRRGVFDLVVCHFGGVNGVFSDAAIELLRDARPGPRALGVVVDRDTNELRSRVDAFRSTYAEYVTGLEPILPGVVMHKPDSSRVGLWIMPDNENEGDMETLLIQALADAEQQRPLLDAATQCIEAMKMVELPRISWQSKTRKATLGCLYQTRKPGCSLPVGINSEELYWLPRDLREHGALNRLSQFIAELTTGSPEYD